MTIVSPLSRDLFLVWLAEVHLPEDARQLRARELLQGLRLVLFVQRGRRRLLGIGPFKFSRAC